MSLDLSLTPVPTAAITVSSLNDLITHGINLINTLPSRMSSPSPPTGTTISWSAGKGDAETKLWKATHNNEPWIARVTELADIGYAELWRRLVAEKSTTEKTALLQPHDVIEPIGEERVFGDINVTGTDTIVSLSPAYKRHERLHLHMQMSTSSSTSKHSQLESSSKLSSTRTFPRKTERGLASSSRCLLRARSMTPHTPTVYIRPSNPYAKLEMGR